MEIQKLSQILVNSTQKQIIFILKQKPQTITQIWKQVKTIKNREGIYKSLEKLRESKLLSRKFNEIEKKYYYKLCFKEIKINNEFKIIIKGLKQ